MIGAAMRLKTIVALVTAIQQTIVSRIVLVFGAAMRFLKPIILMTIMMAMDIVGMTAIQTVNATKLMVVPVKSSVQDLGITKSMQILLGGRQTITMPTPIVTQMIPMHAVCVLEITVRVLTPPMVMLMRMA